MNHQRQRVYGFTVASLLVIQCIDCCVRVVRTAGAVGPKERRAGRRDRELAVIANQLGVSQYQNVQSIVE